MMKPNSSPLVKTVSDFMFLLKVFMFLLFAFYIFSGVTMVYTDEVALIIRMGKLVGDTRAEQIHLPGWIFAFPKPIDDIIRIPVRQVMSVKINELAPLPILAEEFNPGIDPLEEGYCISGDENIFQAGIIVKYQIIDPIYATFNNSAERGLATLISQIAISEMTKISTQYTVDDVLAHKQEELSIQLKNKIQKKLDEIESGLAVLSLEFEELVPPNLTKDAFEEVNTAFINSKNFVTNAERLREEKIPAAHAQSRKTLNQAEAYKYRRLAEAVAESESFSQMVKAYENNPHEIKQDILNKAMTQMLSKGGRIYLIPADEKSKGAINILLGDNAKVAPISNYHYLADD